MTHERHWLCTAAMVLTTRFESLSKYAFEPRMLSPELGEDMQRRECIALLSGAAVCPLAAWAQQPTVPVIGFMSARSPEDSEHLVEAFRRGLREGGFVEGQNVAIEFRWARGQYDLLPAMAADLVSHKVDVLAACGGADEAFLAKNVTSTIPIVFSTGADPVETGLPGQPRAARRQPYRCHHPHPADDEPIVDE